MQPLFTCVWWGAGVLLLCCDSSRVSMDKIVTLWTFAVFVDLWLRGNISLIFLNLGG